MPNGEAFSHTEIQNILHIGLISVLQTGTLSLFIIETGTDGLTYQGVTLTALYSATRCFCQINITSSSDSKS